VTLIVLEVPLSEAVSVTVIVCGPAVLSVAKKVPVTLVIRASAGNVDWLSLLVKCTVPE
jgi:hypothetical protein